MLICRVGTIMMLPSWGCHKHKVRLFCGCDYFVGVDLGAPVGVKSLLTFPPELGIGLMGGRGGGASLEVEGPFLHTLWVLWRPTVKAGI